MINTDYRRSSEETWHIYINIHNSYTDINYLIYFAKYKTSLSLLLSYVLCYTLYLTNVSLFGFTYVGC